MRFPEPLKTLLFIAAGLISTGVPSHALLSTVYPGILHALTDVLEAASITQTVSKSYSDAKDSHAAVSISPSNGVTKMAAALDALKKLQIQTTIPSVTVPSVSIRSCVDFNQFGSQYDQAFKITDEALKEIKAEIDTLNTKKQQVLSAKDQIVAIQAMIPYFSAFGGGMDAELLTFTQKMAPMLSDTQQIIEKAIQADISDINALNHVRIGWNNIDKGVETFDPPQPPGSYRNSCGRCDWGCDTLHCSCRRINGTTNDTTINATSCGSFANINGNLQCGP